MFSDLSYKNKLLLRIMPILLIGLLSLSGGAYWYINRLIKEDLTASMLATTGKTAESINTWFKTLMLEPEVIASSPAARNINTDFRQIDRLNVDRFKALHEKYPDIFQDIYAANSKGEYHAVQKKEGGHSVVVGDISNRRYFQSIMSGGPTQVSRPLVSRITGKPAIFIAAQIKDEQNRPQGLIGTGISLGYVEKLANDLKFGRSGYGIVIANDGTIIHHPDREIAMLKKVDEVGDSSTRELGRLMVSGASGVFSYTFRGQKKVAFYKPIPITGWSIATVVPETELFAPVSRMLTSLAAITAAVMLLAGIAIFLTARSLTRPLRDLALQAREIAAGNLNVRALEIESQDEVGQLAGQFNIMSENLNSMLKELELKNSTLEQEIREREQAQVALVASEEKFSKAFSHVSDFIGIIRLRDRVYIDVNDACFKILGFRRDEIVGHTSNEFDLWADRSVRDKAYREEREAGFFHNFEAYMLTKSGEKRFGLISAEGTEIGGEPCVVYAWRDMTERKKAEDALRVAQEELVRQEKLAILGQLSGTVSHELRNPLGVMSNAIYLLKLTLAGADKKSLEFLDIIKHEIDNSIRIITDLLDFARTKPPQTRAVNAVELIETSLKNCVVPETVVVLKEFNANLPLLKVDPRQIEQVLQNLITNGIQAMPEGGVLLLATQPVQDLEFKGHDGEDSNHEQRTLNTEQSGNFIEISVSDSGEGIAPENIKKLFQPLFTTKPKGIGLGLVVCKNLVEANGGRIKVVSEPGKGTIFTLILPVDVADVQLHPDNISER
jgi:PAS domain S-box-containing protein